jgi:hypothetical protein
MIHEVDELLEKLVKRDADGKVNARQLPPRRFKLSYLVTAWTQRPEDEHRLLSALLSAFIRNPMIKPDLLEGTLAEPDLPVYIDVGQPPSQDRSLADVWSALGGELKPSLDVVVTAPIMVNRNAPIGPLVLEGPSIGLSSANGAAEKVARGAAPPAGLDGDGPPLELVPAGAGTDKPAPGMAIRVRRLRTR